MSLSVSFTELIDTCWDVNFDKVNVILDEHSELIDTCWDVNNRYTTTSLRCLRINRYMLGCKFLLLTDWRVPVQELIDTCWDVNTNAHITI